MSWTEKLPKIDNADEEKQVSNIRPDYVVSPESFHQSYFLIPTSNGNNLIHLFITQTPEGEMKYSFCSSWVVLDFVF